MKDIVTGPKFMSLMPQKADTENISVWNKERLTDREGSNRKDGSPNPLKMDFKKVQSSGFL